MIPEIKAQWVAALRSDDYQQGQGHLTLEDKDCCLGVLCKLAVKAGVDMHVEQDAYGRPGQVSYDYDTATLPSVVMQWAGLTQCNPNVLYEGDERPLAELNDGEEPVSNEPDEVLRPSLTFAQIADLIEEQL